MKRGVRGSSNEHRTINFLAKRNWVAVRAAGSKGMLNLDVLAYHIQTGEVKHIQSKSNHSYSQADIEELRHIRSMIPTMSVSVELWDWYDRTKVPTITIFNQDGTTSTHIPR